MYQSALAGITATRVQPRAISELRTMSLISQLGFVWLQGTLCHNNCQLACMIPPCQFELLALPAEPVLPCAIHHQQGGARLPAQGSVRFHQPT
jgi:hypothetical protein